MKRLAAGALLAALAACGPPPAPAELVAFGHARRSDYASVIRDRHPDLVAQSDDAFSAAERAWRRGAPEPEILHLTRLARIFWRTAEARSHTKDLQDAASAGERAREAATRERDAAQSRLDVARRDAERLNQIISLRAQLADARRAARLDRRAGEARQRVEAAATFLRQIEAMDVERHAPGPLNRARRSVLNAFEAFNAGRYDEALRAADLALADAGAAAAAAAPMLRAAEGQRKLEGELYGMLAEAQAIGLARLEARGLVITLRDLFGAGQQLVGSPRKLQDLVALAKAHPAFRIVVEGHTDNRGASSRNLNLSEGRARTVVLALQAGGVASERLTAVGLGDTAPVADNGTREGRERNRRIEVLFVRPTAEVPSAGAP